MGFDDSFIIPVSDTQAYRQFGNSIIVPVVHDIAKRVVNVLNQYYGSFNKAKKKLEYVPDQREECETGVTDQEVAVL